MVPVRRLPTAIAAATLLHSRRVVRARQPTASDCCVNVRHQQADSPQLGRRSRHHSSVRCRRAGRSRIRTSGRSLNRVEMTQHVGAGPHRGRSPRSSPEVILVDSFDLQDPELVVQTEQH